MSFSLHSSRHCFHSFHFEFFFTPCRIWRFRTAWFRRHFRSPFDIRFILHAYAAILYFLICRRRLIFSLMPSADDATPRLVDFTSAFGFE